MKHTMAASSRKRKMDSIIPEAEFFAEDVTCGGDPDSPSTFHSASASPITNSTNKDIHYRPRSKTGRRKASNTSIEAPVINCHGACPEIGDKVLNYRGQRIVEYRPGRPINPVRLRLSCEMGDVWEHKFAEVKTNQQVKIGEKFSDRVLEKLQNHGYSVQSILSKGRFGSVVLVYSYERRKLLAVKFVLGDIRKALRNPAEMRDSYLTTIPEEILLYETLHHTNVVEMYGYQLLSGRLFLTLEFCENGSLTNLLQMHPGRILAEAPARRYFRDLLAGIEYIHSCRVVHLDIRTQNLLLNQQNTLKLADFDTARRFGEGDPYFTEKVGHKGYTSPEVLMERRYDPRRVDLWSAGVVLFKMIAGRLPFKSDRGKDVMLDMIRKTVLIHFRCPDYVSATFSKSLQALLLAMLRIEPNERPTMQQIKRFSWYSTEEKKVYIGNAYLVQQPQKRLHGPGEILAKKEIGL